PLTALNLVREPEPIEFPYAADLDRVERVRFPVTVRAQVDDAIVSRGLPTESRVEAGPALCPHPRPERAPALPAAPGGELQPHRGPSSSVTRSRARARIPSRM